MAALWDVPVRLLQPPVALSAGVVFCSEADEGAWIRRLDAQGRAVWHAWVEEPCSTPLHVGSEQVFLGVGDSVRALSLGSGQPLWSTSLPGLKARRTEAARGPGLSRFGPHLIVGAERLLVALDARSGEVQWQEEVEHGQHYLFEHADGLARVRARASGPPRYSHRSDGTEAEGHGVRTSERSAPLWTAADLEAATGLSQLDHFASAPRQVGTAQYLLVQRDDSPSPVIRRVTSPDGRRQATGGKRSPPRPTGVALLRMSSAGWTGVEVTAGRGHRVLAVGENNQPAANLLDVGAALVFSTASEDGDSVTLQAWSADLQPLWQRADQVLLAVSGETILAGWAPGPFRHQTRAEQEEGGLTLSALDAQGEDRGSLRLPWALFAMPYGPSCRKQQCYLSAPDGALVALKLPQTGAR